MTTRRPALAVATVAALLGLLLLVGVPAHAMSADGVEDAGDPPLGALAVGGGLGLAVLVGAVLLARRRRDDDLPPT